MQAEASPSSSGFLARTFLAALAIRWIYDIILYATMGVDGVTGVDSSGYMVMAQNFAEAIAQGSVSGLQWLGPTPFNMPLFTWLVTINVVFFGTYAPLTYVMTQGVLDSATCVIVYHLAAAIDERLARPAAIFAVLNPTQIVMAGLFYTDTPFLFFTALFLLGSLRWMRVPGWQDALLIGLALGCATLTRVLAAPWSLALLGFLLSALALRRMLSPARIAQLALAGAMAGLCAGVILARNVTQFDAWSLTPQGGQHMSRWVVPLIKQAHDGTPWVQSYEALEKRAAERYGPEDLNPFVQSERYRLIATEEMRSFSLRSVALAWAYGAAINIGSSGIILSPPILQLPRTGFYGTPGTTMPDKIFNFLFRSDNPLYTWFLLIGTAGVIAIRLLQLTGASFLVWQHGLRLEFLLLAGWCVYILLINGPVASPKYRLPLEPVLVVLSAAGWVTMRRGFARRA